MPTTFLNPVAYQAGGTITIDLPEGCSLRVFFGAGAVGHFEEGPGSRSPGTRTVHRGGPAKTWILRDFASSPRFTITAGDAASGVKLSGTPGGVGNSYSAERVRLLTIGQALTAEQEAFMDVGGPSTYVLSLTRGDSMVAP